MKHVFLIQPCFITMEELELIGRGMSALADLAMKQGEYVMAKKLRESVAFVKAGIAHFKESSYQVIQ